tara:strand:- start:1222 stop:1758 length:537 start_codon:yes stop_codon:yes gene_type:complete
MEKIPKNWKTRDLWYAAVAGGGIIALFIGLMFFAAIRATASELVHEFHSPSFSGVGWSTHMLSIEQLQHNRKEDMRERAEAQDRQDERDEKNKTINKFIKNVESRIYANLSKQLVDNMFATCDAEDETCNAPLTGTADIEGSLLVWTKDPDLGTITLVITDADGTTSTMVVPVGDFGF